MASTKNTIVDIDTGACDSIVPDANPEPFKDDGAAAALVVTEEPKPVQEDPKPVQEATGKEENKDVEGGTKNQGNSRKSRFRNLPCTICFAIIWLLCVPGIVSWHVGLGQLWTPIKDLQINIRKGFDDILKFDRLEPDSIRMASHSATAVSKCGINAARCCRDIGASPTWPTTTTAPRFSPGRPIQGSTECNLLSNTQSMNAKAEQDAINNIFDSTLSTVQKVANDKYFGTSGMKHSANKLNDMQKQIQSVNGCAFCQQDCTVGVPTFCAIYVSADDLAKGVAEVDQEVDKFINTENLNDIRDYEEYLTYLHMVPYLMVIGMVFFTLFWCRSAECICCVPKEEGRVGAGCANCAIIPFILFWLLAFVVFIIILAIGFAFPIAADEVKVEPLNGDPTVTQAIDHMKLNYPEFWNTVFGDLESGMTNLWLSSIFMVLVAKLVLLYSFSLCCCCPYDKRGCCLRHKRKLLQEGNSA